MKFAGVLAALSLLSACASGPSTPKKTARLEIQEDVGFTIVS